MKIENYRKRKDLGFIDLQPGEEEGTVVATIQTFDSGTKEPIADEDIVINVDVLEAQLPNKHGRIAELQTEIAAIEQSIIDDETLIADARKLLKA